MGSDTNFCGLSGSWAVNELQKGSSLAWVASEKCKALKEKKIPHLRWSQAPPLPWLRQGSADIYIYIYMYIYIYIYHIVIGSMSLQSVYNTYFEPRFELVAPRPLRTAQASSSGSTKWLWAFQPPNLMPRHVEVWWKRLGSGSGKKKGSKKASSPNAQRFGMF